MLDNNLSKMRELIKTLNYHTELYDKGKPQISDKQWDDMYFELVDLEKAYQTYCKDSPTQKVHFEMVGELSKVEHDHPMLSLEKTKDIKEINSFIGDNSVVVMSKMDGLTCSLRYKNGRLVGAETRGDGLVGENIFHNALQVKSIPKKIKYKQDLTIDGEIICKDSDFETFKKEYKNSRNFASGSIRLLNSQESSNRKLTFVAWDCITDLEYIHTLTEKLQMLDYFGFLVVPYCLVENAEKDLLKIKQMETELDYPTDGAVFKYDDLVQYNAAGRTDHHFKGGIAFKFYDEEYKTNLLNIEYTMGRTGVLTPVAVFEPIEIEGTTVERASLHNLSVMMDLLGQAYKGQPIKVFKSNMIIPQVSWGEKREYLLSDFRCENCPICGGDTVLRNNEGVVTLHCDNPDCQGKLINKLDHFCGKKGLDIKGLSAATLEKLVEWGWVSTYVDIYRLREHQDAWKRKAGFGDKSVERILKAIDESRNPTLDAIISAAGIPLIGRSVSKKLSQQIETYEDFRYKVESGFDFSQYESFGEVMSTSILNFDYKDLDNVVDCALTIQNTKEEKSGTESLKDKVFCLTGKVSKVKNRDELKTIIEQNGGKVVSSMSSKVDYLINNDANSTSAKNKAAKEANVPIITEDDFLSMIMN